MSFFLSLLCIEILGLLLITILGLLLKYRYSILEFLTLSYLSGLGLISIMQFLFYLLKISMSLFLILSVSGVALAMLLILYFKLNGKSMIRYNKAERLKIWEKFIILGLFIQFAWVIIHVLPVPVRSYDSVADFSLKAKIFFLDGGIPRGFFKFPESTVTHVDYPLLLPFYMAWVYRFIGFNDVVIARIMPFLYMVFIGLFYSLLRRFFDRKYALIAAFALATIPQISRFSMILYADMVLTAFVTCAFLYFMLYLLRGGPAPLVFASVLFGISGLVKNEGLVFLVGFFICLILIRVKIKYFLFSLLTVSLIALPWFILKYSSGLVNSDINLKLLTFEKFISNLKSSHVLLFELQREVFNPKKWNLLWVISGLVVIIKARRFISARILYGAIFIFLTAVFYFAALLCTTAYDMTYFGEKVFARSLMHFCGMFVFLTACLLWPAKEDPNA